MYFSHDCSNECETVSKNRKTGVFSTTFSVLKILPFFSLKEQYEFIYTNNVAVKIFT